MSKIHSMVWPGGRATENSKRRLLSDGSKGEIEYYYLEKRPWKLGTDENHALSAHNPSPLEGEGLVKHLLIMGNLGQMNVIDNSVLEDWEQYAISLEKPLSGEDLSAGFQQDNLLDENIKISLMLINYPGYGGTTSKLCPDNINRNNELMLDYARRDGWDQSQIVLIGSSIGTGSIVHLAQRSKAGSEQFYRIILISPFTSLASQHWALWIFSKIHALDYEKYNSLHSVKSFENQWVGFIHGIDDTIIKHKSSSKLYYALPSSNSKMLVFLENTGHGGTREAGCDALRYMLRAKWGTQTIVGGNLL